MRVYVVLVGLLLGLVVSGGTWANESGSAPVEWLEAAGANQLAKAVDAAQSARGGKAVATAKARLEKALAQSSAGDKKLVPLAHYYLGLVEYRKMSKVFDKNPAAAVPHIDAAISHLKKALASDSEFGDARALLSNCMGWKISTDASLTMKLGPQSAMEMQRAQASSPESPRVWYLAALSQYHTPEQWGGGKKKALAGFKKAAKLFESQKPASKLHPTWGRAELHTWKGQAHLAMGNKAEAKKDFLCVLDLEPSNSWVKNQLLPQCK